MAVNLKPCRRLAPVKGVRVASAATGVKRSGKKDLAILSVCEGAAVSAVFTRSRCPAAPVELCRRHLRRRKGTRALVVNSGVANAGTGAQGLANAQATCEMVAALLGCGPAQVLPFSTGVIIEHLPIDLIGKGIGRCAAGLSPAGWVGAAQAIMTTDTVAKGTSRKVALRDGSAAVTGIAKGSGMIHPNMATMLAFVATDAAVPQGDLDGAVREICGSTFNEISVDGDTSTNDSFVIVATGRVATRAAERGKALQAIGDVAEELALAIVRDGEGATKLVTISVSGSDDRSCRNVAASIATSPLVKTALHAADANIGRLLMAVGKADAKFRQEDLQVAINGRPVIGGGTTAPGYDEREVSKEMRRAEIDVTVSLGAKRGRPARMRTCDLGAEYLRINSDYRNRS